MKYSAWLLAAILTWSCSSKKSNTTWETYGGNNEHTHYSSLTQIDTSNVSTLRPAWVYHTGDADSNTQIQVNPVIIGNTLYGVSPKLRLFALDAATGKPKWTFDPVDTSTGNSSRGRGYFSMNVCRGVAFYNGGDTDQRLFYAAGSLLYCINAQTGRRIQSFGSNGTIDLHDNMERDVKNLYVASTTPGTIYKDMIIVPTRVAEDAAAAPGYIRAFDVHSGKLRWIFHTIPMPNEVGYNTWKDKEAYRHIGGANAWSGFSLDEQRGILFAPIGSASFDFYGGKRLGDGLFANCVVALDANTGKPYWHFQTVHHDVWDRDPPTAPVLVTIEKNGQRTDAVAQVTKSGFVFLFNRQTGQPIYPINETPVPSQSELAGEELSPTQPIPSLPKPFVRQTLLEKDLNNIIPAAEQEDLKKKLASYKTGNLYTPPSKEGTVIFPGFDGGAEWGGPAYDPSSGILYVNASEVPWVLTMVEVNNKQPSAGSIQTNLEAGKTLYATNCMQCHGTERQGGGNYPALTGVAKKYSEEQFEQLLASGRRMMPAFPQLGEAEKKALASFILNLSDLQQNKYVRTPKEEDPYYKMPYSITGYNKFYTAEGYPAVAPPWGSLNAINLNTGQLVWKDTLGDYPELKAKGIHSGTENYGGPAVTAGGLVFIAATRDGMFRAFNKRTGKLLWETKLPAAGFATPSVYEVNGKQYIVIACGGGKLKAPSGDAYVAFALP